MDSFILVIFGGTGDLSRKKLLPALFNLFLKEKLPLKFSILAVGSKKITDQGYREMIFQSLSFCAERLDLQLINSFTSNLYYVANDVTQQEDYQPICQKIDELKESRSITKKNVIYYLAVPPNLLPDIVNKLNYVNACGDIHNSKIVIEKPFGRDKQSAVELNHHLLKVFNESQIYRIDHYLGKDTVQNIMFFRFGNSVFEPLWNSKYIANIRITVAEDIGIENRSRFYEQAGIVRDIVQNHIMQLIALVAMEPPVGFDAENIRDERVKVLKSIKKINPSTMGNGLIRGQYTSNNDKDHPLRGYRQEEGVDPKSNVPTFFAGKLFIENWRWTDVPFYIRAGKRMKKKLTEIVIQFKHPPLKLFGENSEYINPNYLIIKIQPDERIFLKINIKTPGIANSQSLVDMDFNYVDLEKSESYPAYERLILDCIRGDQTLFARQDGIEAMWDIVDPINAKWDTEEAKDLYFYKTGTWGPQEAEGLLQKDNFSWKYD